MRCVEEVEPLVLRRLLEAYMSDYDLTFRVRADRPADVRDLGDAFRGAFRKSKAKGCGAGDDRMPYLDCEIDGVSVCPVLETCGHTQTTATAVVSTLNTRVPRFDPPDTEEVPSDTLYPPYDPWWTRIARCFFPLYREEA